MNESISRRTLLKSTGAILALPFLESIFPARSYGSSTAIKPPVRMGIFSVTGGTVLESWKPSTVGNLTKLPSILRPLEFAREDILILSGLSQSGQSDNLNAHEHCALMHLTGSDLVKKEGGTLYAGVSVDQFAAQRIGDKSILPSLEIGINGNQYSFQNANTPVPYENNPRFVYERMFKGRRPVTPDWQRRGTNLPMDQQRHVLGNEDQSVIDLVLEQAKDLRKSLGGNDKEKLDGYLSSVRAVEMRLQLLEARVKAELLDTNNPHNAQLIKPSLFPESIPFGQISSEIERDPERHGEYISLMAELMVLAFQTDTTRVAVFAAGSDEASFPGVVTVGYERHCHTLEHQGNADKPENADPIAREACRQIHAWYTSLFAEMVRKMKTIDEGGSTLLDNSMLLFTSYMADGGHGTNDYPVLIAGKAGNSLRTGRHIQYEKDTPVANLYLEMLARIGVNADTFGNSHTSKNARYNGKLPGLI